MKKTFKYFAIIWAILFIVFNLICFATPSEYDGMSKFGGAFWAGYIFITVAFIGNLLCAYIAFKADSKEKMFLNVPLLKISYAGLVLMLIFGGLCMAVPGLPNWVGAVVCLIILVFNAAAVIKAKGAAEAVEIVDTKIKAQTLFIRSLTADASSLLSRAATPEAKEACKKVYEAIRYSDPMSNDALTDVESQITLKFNELSNAVKSGADNIGTVADEIVELVGDRNKKCKVGK